MKEGDQSNNSSDQSNNPNFLIFPAEDTNNLTFLNNKREREDSYKRKCNYCNSNTGDLLNFSSYIEMISYLNENVLKAPYVIQSENNFFPHLDQAKMTCCRNCLMKRFFSKELLRSFYEDDTIPIPSCSFDKKEDSQKISLLSLYSLYLFQFIQANDNNVGNLVKNIQKCLGDIIRVLFQLIQFDNDNKGQKTTDIISEIDNTKKVLESLNGIANENESLEKEIEKVFYSILNSQNSLTIDTIKKDLKDMSIQLIQKNIINDYSNDINDLRNKIIYKYNPESIVIGNIFDNNDNNFSSTTPLPIMNNQQFPFAYQPIMSQSPLLNDNPILHNQNYSIDQMNLSYNNPLTYLSKESQYPFLMNSHLSQIPISTLDNIAQINPMSSISIQNMNPYQNYSRINNNLNINPNQFQLLNPSSNQWANHDIIPSNIQRPMQFPPHLQKYNECNLHFDLDTLQSNYSNKSQLHTQPQYQSPSLLNMNLQSDYNLVDLLRCKMTSNQFPSFINEVNKNKTISEKPEEKKKEDNIIINAFNEIAKSEKIKQHTAVKKDLKK